MPTQRGNNLRGPLRLGLIARNGGLRGGQARDRHAVRRARDVVHADLYTRQPDHRWLLTSASRLEDSLDLQSVQCRLTLADLYRKVELTAS